MLASNWVYRLLKETFDNLETKSCVQAALLLGFALVLASAPCTFGQVASQLAVPKTAPKTWIDPDTGHRITRLSDTPNAKAIYFNQNSHTPDGKDMIYISPRGIHVVNMSTFETKLLVRCVLQNVVVGTQTRRVFFTKAGDGQHIFTVDIDTQQVTKLPVALPTGAFLTSVNADETLLGGYYASLGTLNYQGYEMQGRQELLNEKKNAPAAPGSSSNESARDLLHAENAKIKAKATELRFAAHTPQYIFTEEIQSGKVNFILKGTDWLNHIQFSPTDPNLLMYAHEGPSLKVDRVWTIRTDGSKNQLIHKRSSPNEIATHEFWSKDGKTIWFDLQKSKGEDFSLAGFKVDTGEEVTYHLGKSEASIHYNVSPDGKLFCGDGNQPAHGEIGLNGHRTLNRKWIELLRPMPDGSLHATRLVNLSGNDYADTEPDME